LVSIEYEDILAQKLLPRRLQTAMRLALLREKIFEIVDVDEKGALVAQWLALLTSDLEGLGSNPG
jgi:hypothetical protein